MKRSGSAVWKGGLKDGHGTVSTQTRTLSSVPYTWRMRFENEQGTNPEELVAAAHAACFSMALSGRLAANGMMPEDIETTATVTFEKVGEGFTISESHLHTRVKASGGDQTAFEKAVEAAKIGCPISRSLNAKITLDAELA